jgi:hypothetical protein
MGTKMVVLFIIVHIVRSGCFSQRVAIVEYALAVARDILINGLII